MPTVALIAGAGLAAYGTIKKNEDEAQAEANNAAYYKEQSNFAAATGQRDLDVFYQRAYQTVGTREASYAAGGVQNTGSALFVAEDQFYRQQKEAQAIKAMTAQKVLMADTKAGYASGMADTYGSFGYNALTGLTAGGTILASGIGRMGSNGASSPDPALGAGRYGAPY